KVYGSTGVSWWDWQEAGPVARRAISTRVPSVAHPTAVPGMPLLAKGAAGDIVVWGEEPLIPAGDPIVVDGGFGPKALAAVKAFQVQHGLTPDGIIGSATWSALLNYQPTAISWAPGATRLTKRMVKPLTAAAVAAADT